jgi:hypothetical protein
MSVTTLELAQSLGLSEAQLFQQALQSFLREKRREAMQIRLEILSRYQVSNLAEMEEGIRTGNIAEHPAWEDLITVENLDARLEELVHLGINK